MWADYFIPPKVKADGITRDGFTTKYYIAFIEIDGNGYYVNMFVTYQN